MNTGTRAQRELERVLFIDWTPVDCRLRSGAKLVREYLRRASLWASVLNVGDEWAFFDIARTVDSSINIATDAARLIQERLESCGMNPYYVQKVCVWHLEWIEADVRGLVGCFGLPTPYEPLIRMFERGQTLYLDKGFITVNGFGGIRVGASADHRSFEPIMDINGDLDQFDS